MIGERSALLLDNAIAAVQQKRAASAASKAVFAQAATGKSGAKPKAKAKLGMMTAKKLSTAKPAAAGDKMAAKTLSTAKPAGTAASDPDAITPYLTADDLLGLADQTATAEETKAAAKAQYDTLVADTSMANDDINRRTVRNVADANNDAAARGIYSSGIRAGNVGMAQSEGQRDLSANAGRIGLAATQVLAANAGADRRLAGYQQGLASKAAENGAALPVDPYAGNIKGAPTPKKLKPKKAVRRA